MTKEQLYKKFAGYYDKIYEKLDHKKESDFIKWAVNKYKTSKGDENLELARICQSHLENGVFNSSFVFLVKENGNLDFAIDEHTLGVFEMEKVIDLMKNTGFNVFIYSDFEDKEWRIGTGERPVFVGVKQQKNLSLSII